MPCAFLQEPYRPVKSEGRGVGNYLVALLNFLGMCHLKGTKGKRIGNRPPWRVASGY